MADDKSKKQSVITFLTSVAVTLMMGLIIMVSLFANVIPSPADRTANSASFTTQHHGITLR